MGDAQLCARLEFRPGVTFCKIKCVGVTLGQNVLWPCPALLSRPQCWLEVFVSGLLDQDQTHPCVSQIQAQAEARCLVLMRLSGCCISYKSSLGTTVQALIPAADDDSNTSQLSCALVTPDQLSMRNATPGNSQQVKSVDLVFANIYFSSTFDASFNKWLYTECGGWH